MFFRITNVAQFRKDLGKYAPRITSSTQTKKNIYDIDDKGGKHRDIVSSGIAFARAGLNTLGVEQNLEDPHFDKGSQLLERDELGDKGVYDSVFSKNGNTHGIILVTTRGRFQVVLTIILDLTSVLHQQNGTHAKRKWRKSETYSRDQSMSWNCSRAM